MKQLLFIITLLFSFNTVAQDNPEPKFPPIGDVESKSISQICAQTSRNIISSYQTMEYQLDRSLQVDNGKAVQVAKKLMLEFAKLYHYLDCREVLKENNK